MGKFLDNNGLSHLILLIKNMFVKKEFKTGSSSTYKVLSDNNLTDELVTKIQNAGDSTFSGNYNDLTNKPDLTVYAKSTDVTTAINTALANVNKKEIVTSTSQMTDANTIYLLANSATEENNTYDEYLVINNVPEKIGTTAVDLSGYVRKSDLITITNEEIEQIVESAFTEE